MRREWVHYMAMACKSKVEYMEIADNVSHERNFLFTSWIREAFHSS
jgi:hypothetical protein